jgi:predicted ATPase
MKIRRIVLKNVRNFVDFDYTFEDSWTGEIPDALLLIGPNGSGKTTILEVIAELWQLVAEYFQDSELHLPNPLSYNSLAAIEIIGFEREPLWVSFTGLSEQLPDFISTEIDAHRVAIWSRQDIPEGTTSLSSDYAEPGNPYFTYRWGEQMSHWKQKWSQLLTQNILGKVSDLPNLVYLPSEIRQLLPVKEKFTVQPESEDYHWLARYEPVLSRKGSLHNYLYNLKVVDETAFQQIVEQANDFMPDKQLNGFDRRTGDLLVKLKNGLEHSINNLSSGEKQVLLMLATITRWLRPGGIVLIDEPDLHLHPTLTTAFVAHLRRMIKEKGGQLIIASHVTELWQDFTESHRVELGRLGEMV